MKLSIKKATGQTIAYFSIMQFFPNQTKLAIFADNDGLNVCYFIMEKSAARVRDGKHLPLLIQVHPAAQVYAETAALKQQKRPTKKEKERKGEN